MIIVPLGQRGVQLLVPSAQDHIARNVLEHGVQWYEQDLLEAIQARVSGGTFVDVGAHYGNHTLFFATECDASLVIAIEPDQENYLILGQNMILNNALQRVICLKALVHPTWRQARTRMNDREPEIRSMLPIIEEGDGASGDVPAHTLDEILAGSNDIRLIKIDAEEMGVKVLRSGEQTIRAYRPLVAIEAASEEEQRDVEGWLGLKHGYRQVGEFCATPTFLWEG